MSKYKCKVNVYCSENIGNTTFKTRFKSNKLNMLNVVHEILGDEQSRTNNEITSFKIKMKNKNNKHIITGNYLDSSIKIINK